MSVVSCLFCSEFFADAADVARSVFSKMAELLARPPPTCIYANHCLHKTFAMNVTRLSPTAMEKEAKEEAAASRRAPKPRMAKACFVWT